MKGKYMELNSAKINNKFNFQSSTYKGIPLGTKRDEIKEIISFLCDDLDNACDYKDAKRKLSIASENNAIEKLNEITYKNGDYIIRTFLKVSGDGQAKILDKLTSENISIAPKLVYSKNYGDHTIIISKIDGLSEGELIPFDQGYNLIDDNTKKEAYKDVQKLLKIGYVNQAMLNGNSAWFITPKSKKIIVLDWRNLRRAQDGEAINLLNDIYKTIFKK